MTRCRDKPARRQGRQEMKERKIRLNPRMTLQADAPSRFFKFLLLSSFLGGLGALAVYLCTLAPFTRVILGVGACLGHLVLMIISHNWCYGQALPRHTGKIIHLSHGLLILALPVALVGACGSGLARAPLLSS